MQNIITEIFVILINIMWFIPIRLSRSIYMIYFRIKRRFMTEQQCQLQIDALEIKIKMCEEKNAERKSKLSEEK